MKNATWPIILILYSLVSCNAQIKVVLSITNRSSNPIDSITIPYKKIKISEKIDPGNTKTITIDLIQKDYSGEGVIPLYLFQKNRKITTSWGFHDWGQLAKTREYLYLFDHGINYKDEKLIEPGEFTVFVADMTSSKIDSLIIPDEIIQKKYVTATHIELKLNYSGFEKNPVLKIYQDGKYFSIPIEHDWKNWNSTQEIIYVYDNGVSKQL